MSRRYSQQGVSMIGILVMISMFAFFLTVALRLMPAYMEGRKVKAAIDTVADSVSASQSLRDVNRRVTNVFVTNMVEGIKASEVKVYRDKESIIIDASYESRVNLFEGIDAVLVFDDIKRTVN